MSLLPPHYISGFVDGEGCFALKYRREIKLNRKNKPVYFYWDVEFAILLRGDDIDILHAIKKTLGCGKISMSKRGDARYAVNNISELSNIIVPFFSKYQLRAKKKYDFMLWKEAVEIFQRNQRKKINSEPGKDGFQKTNWNPGDLKRLLAIHEEMAKYRKNTDKRPWKWLVRK